MYFVYLAALRSHFLKEGVWREDVKEAHLR